MKYAVQFNCIINIKISCIKIFGCKCVIKLKKNGKHNVKITEENINLCLYGG